MRYQILSFSNCSSVYPIIALTIIKKLKAARMRLGFIKLEDKEPLINQILAQSFIVYAVFSVSLSKQNLFNKK